MLFSPNGEEASQRMEIDRGNPTPYPFKMASSQSFQTGSRPVAVIVLAKSAGVRLSSMVNCSVAWVPAGFPLRRLRRGGLLGAVQVVAASPGVATGVGGAAGGHVGGSESHHIVTEFGGLAGGNHNAGGGEAKSGRRDQLHELTVAEVAIGVGSVLVVAGVGSHAGEGDRELGFPAMLVQVFEVGREGEGFGAPVGKAKEGADTDTAEASAVGAFRAFQAPVEILSWVQRCAEFCKCRGGRSLDRR